MNYAEIKYNDIANGPGVRTSIFVSGCTHHCKGCFNEVAWDFNYGMPFTDETIDEIIESIKPSYIAGLTLLGGEPFEPANQKGLLPLLERVNRYILIRIYGVLQAICLIKILWSVCITHTQRLQECCPSSTYVLMGSLLNN